MRKIIDAIWTLVQDGQELIAETISLIWGDIGPSCGIFVVSCAIITAYYARNSVETFVTALLPSVERGLVGGIASVIVISLFRAHSSLIREERRKNKELEDRLKVFTERRSLDLQFGEEIEGCVVDTAFIGGQLPVRYFRIMVSNGTNSTARNCQGRLIGIERKNNRGEYESLGFQERVSLTWATFQNPLPIATDIPRFERVPLDAIIFTSRNTIGLPTQGLFWPQSFDVSRVRVNGEYKFVFLVSADELETQRFEIAFNWQSVWNEVRPNGQG